MHQTHQITAVAIRAAREAGAIALKGFRSSGLEVKVKADKHDLVTHYDRVCEAHISSVILAAYPDSSIVAEEEASTAGTGALTWFIDPIDGTSNFARGIAMWAVSIAVARDGEMIVGVIFDPVSEQLFWADSRGAFLIEGGVQRREQQSALHSRGNTDPERATVALNFPLARDLVLYPGLALEQYAEVTQAFSQVRGLGSTCIALAWVAAGWLDVTISFETSPWDVAAGALIIRRAGGVFHGYREGQMTAASVAHHARHYYAAVAEGEYELLHDIMRSQSIGRG